VIRIFVAGLACCAAILAAGAAASSSALPGLMTSKVRWPANNGPSLAPRLDAIGMPRLSSEGTRLHTHQHLDIVVRGRGRPIPAGIGIDALDRFIAPLHTHDFAGIIHVESPKVQKFTLGQFFDVWGLRFTKKCLGGYCAKGNERVWVFVNGRRVKGNPRAVALREHYEIAIAFGTYASIPKPIPTSFAFPAGL
jgi:hypothetical protein